ncbi:MAG: RNA polymerase sigma-70 factor [Adhaeribacter sp.]
MDSSGALGLTSSAEDRLEALPGLSEQEAGSVPAARVTDPELFIRKAFETDPQAGCSLLFRHYYAPLCSHAARLLYSKARAEDLVSEIFYQFYQKQTYLTVSTSYRAYLYKAVRHRAYNQLQAEINRSVDLTDYEHLPDAGELRPDALMQYEELSQQVEAAINALPPQRQKIYLMHRFDNRKYADIAEELQLSVRTVEVQIRKASQFLRETIAQNWGLLLILSLSLSLPA